MPKIAMKMQLYREFAEEYKKRHNPIWPALTLLLKDYGISEYTIFLDDETYTLFSVLTVDEPDRLDRLGSEAIMKAWWNYMKDIMLTNEDNSPVAIPLREMFYLP
jgi:L-rhamnose mutarotase